MIKKFLAVSGLALTSLAASADIGASWIDGLVNTGAGLTGGVVDTHYAFSSISGTATGTDGYGVVTGVVRPVPAWVANTATSAWLTPSANAAASYDRTSSGQYKWTLTFDLTGFDAATASFAGRWAADDSGYIHLNGNLIETGARKSAWTDFSATQGFVSGVNTLDFFVTNLPHPVSSPTGLRVEFLSSAVSAPTPPVPHLPAPVLAVPEPSSSVMILAGLLVVGAVARRRIG